MKPTEGGSEGMLSEAVVTDITEQETSSSNGVHPGMKVPPRQQEKHHRIGPFVKAFCKTCNKQWSGKNTQAVAAIHARRFRHDVHADVSFSYDYVYAEPNGKDHSPTALFSDEELA